MADVQSILSALQLPPMFDVSAGNLMPGAPQKPAAPQQPAAPQIPKTVGEAAQGLMQANAATKAATQPGIDASQKAYESAVGDVVKAQGNRPEWTPPVNNAHHMDPQQMREQANWLMLAASLTGLLTRQPMTAAMTAAAGALKGLREGDQAQYDEKIKNYERHYKESVDKFRSEIDAYKDILKNKEWTVAQQLNELHTKATAQRNELLANTTDFNAIRDAINASDRLAAQSQAHLDRLAAQRELKEFRMAQLANKQGGAGKVSTLQFKMNEVDELVQQKKLTPEEGAIRKKYLLTGQRRMLLGEERAYAQTVQLKLANSELEQLEKQGVQMPILGDIHFDSNGAVSAVSRYGQKRELTDQEQQIVTAAQLFAEAAGHIQSGARLTDQAFARVVREFIPQPGDKPGAAQFKREHRQALVQAGDIISGSLAEKNPAPAAAPAVGVKPTLEQFLEKARASNPGKTEQELSDYYHKKYGGA